MVPVSDWLIEGRLVRTPCRRCGQPTLSVLEYAFESLCVRCGVGPRLPARLPIGERAHWRVGQGGVGFSHQVRPGVELERAPVSVRTVAVVDRMRAIDIPSTAARLRRASRGEAMYTAAWFCEGDVRAAGFDAFVLREALAVRWSGPARGFALWSRSGRGGWKPGAAFWTDPTSGLVHYGRCSAVPATLFT